MEIFFRKLKKVLPGILVFAGSFIIAYGWASYHFNKHEGIYWIKMTGLWLFTAAGYLAAKKLFLYVVKKYKRHIFWESDFYQHLDRLFFVCSLFFLIYLIKIEWQSLLFVSLLLPVIFLFFQKAVSNHPGSELWRKANNAIFIMVYFLFILEAFLQYSAYSYYIFDNNIRFFNIVLFRTIAMTFFWLFGFMTAIAWFVYLRGKIRYLFIIIWSLLFIFAVGLWAVNLGILYYSGLYLSPVVIQHAEGAGRVVQNRFTYLIGAGALVIVFSFFLVLLTAIKSWIKAGSRLFSYYSYVVGSLMLFVILSVASFGNTPEVVVAKSFYNYYLGAENIAELDPVVGEKIKKFGLNYETEKFYIVSNEKVFTPTTTKLLPERLLRNRPNIVVLFLESFSSRLTDVYGSKFKGVTPNLKRFSDDENTTVFQKYYNASTPTITGSLSQLCSFLTPTGHNEIQEERKLQSHRLLCLPEILKEEAGYKYSSYVTAVDKNYANKGGIFASMGVDEIFGTKELAKYIKGEPLSWGYSDHQLFPALWNFMNSAPQPFLMMLATVDTHPPFNLPKDAVNYEDGKSPVLNMFHTTDHAFGIFWDEFRKSKFYDNTIIIAVADHAIFPGAIATDLFKEEAGELTYYDENLLSIYVPDSVLPKEVNVYSSGIDMLPTVLQLLNINIPNSFEGHSIFDDRNQYPNLLGMHELGLYINQEKGNKRSVLYSTPELIECGNYTSNPSEGLTLCDYKNFYEWKRRMFEEGRSWKH